MLSFGNQKCRIAAEMAQLPATFGLRATPSEIFRVNPNTSYVADDDRVVLYVDVWTAGGWSSYSKGALAELQAQAVDLDIVRSVKELHELFTGSWVQTDADMSVILDLRLDDAPHPHGGIWWRTHHLVRILGGTA